MEILELEFRAKLDDLRKCAERRYEDYGNFAPKENREALMAAAAGYKNAVWDINEWLKSQYDGWHDLRENPEDMPEVGKHLYLIIRLGRVEGYHVVMDDGKFEDVIGWMSSGVHNFCFDKVIGWAIKPMVPEFPDRFKGGE